MRFLYKNFKSVDYNLGIGIHNLIFIQLAVMSQSESKPIQKFGELSYDKSKKRGRGRTGINVYEGKLMDLVIAVKVIESDRTEKSQLEIKKSKSDTVPTNIKILRSITHQNIIRIYNFQLTDEKILIPMELCDNNLSEYLEMKDNLSNDTRLDILKQIGEGIKFLHTGEKAICHQKLKPQNILIKLQSKKVEVKLADFGYAEYVERDAPSTSTGTNSNSVWAPPEGCSNKLSVDIYTYGCLIKMVLTDQRNKQHPFGDLNDDKSILKNVKDANRVNFLALTDDQTDLFKLADLAIDDAIQKDPERRPDISTLIEHPLFWTPMQKGNFLRDIRNDYRKKNTKHKKNFRRGKFIGPFENMFNKNLRKSSRNKQPLHWATKCKLLSALLDAKIEDPNFPQYDIDYDTNGFNLIAFIRNICAHFAEYKTSKAGKKYKEVLASKNKFIEHVINEYPYLIHDIFTCYRDKLFRKKYLDDNYNDYFKNLVNSTSFEIISKKS